MSSTAPRFVGRYALFDVIASGGMASVHLGRLMGQVGFARTVAIKRLHANFAADPEFVAMLMDEARLAARIRHPNVVPTLDIVAEGKEVLLVMEYVAGESLMQLLKTARTENRPPPIPVVVDIMVGVLNGLHAAHEATDEHGEPLGIVHRDVSPHNILVGKDGVARVLDFGIAKAQGRMHQTRGSQVKGKLRYMPAEQMLTRKVTRAADVYSASVVLWEALTGQRLFDGENDAQVMMRVLEGSAAAPSTVRRDIPPELDAIVSRGLSREPEARFPTARAMAHALESTISPVTRSAVSDWVLTTVGDAIGRREEHVAAVERSSGSEPSVSDSSRILELPRRTLPAGVVDNSTLSHSGSVSRSVAPSARKTKSGRGASWRLVFGTGGIALLAGIALASLFRAPGGSATAASSGARLAPSTGAPAQSASGLAAQALAFKTPAVEPPMPAAAPVAATAASAATAVETVTSAAPVVEAARAASSPRLKAPKPAPKPRVQRAPATTPPPSSARIYRRD